jgi:2-polyprenyl-3-methyl-5-hydroxy-6-metoxy-1,4-benzoquinol methylase
MIDADSDKNFKLIDGVYFSATTREKFLDFEKNYLTVREKEKRVLSLEEIKKLPSVDRKSPDYALWKIRRKNIHRFQSHISKKKKSLRILDIGCGNGFFTHMLANGHVVAGVDVNLTELHQAAKAFPDSNIKWYYLDILNEVLPETAFDLITFCASFQYFEDPTKILTLCKSLLNKEGEIHIIDSPFYASEKRESARTNSVNYYAKMKVEGMINYYHHNTFDVLNGFNYRFGYKPNKFLLKFMNDSPFPWIIIK